MNEQVSALFANRIIRRINVQGAKKVSYVERVPTKGLEAAHEKT
jgi:hypothetical protein